MKKSTAILKMKCPRCYEGNLFSYPHAFAPSRLSQMPEQCPCCGLSFVQEPGFYTGAMYVSYALNVLLFIVFFFVCLIGLKMDGLDFLLIYIPTVLFLSPFLFRYSRTIFIHLFYSYKPQV